MARIARKSAAGRKPARKTASKHGARKTSARKTRARKTTSARKRTGHASARKSTRKWSGRVTATSDALDLENSVFKKDSPKAIARSLKRSAEHSHRRKSDPYRSAMSMLVFYINRAGRNLPATRKRTLEAAKGELRRAFGREAG
ncbi:MAG: DUF3175 domain-containing protein [Rhizobiales bacterium]|nr:DUF3175 domain-containing protein [Hyphomicrobiales bacterium]